MFQLQHHECPQYKLKWQTMETYINANTCTYFQNLEKVHKNNKSVYLPHKPYAGKKSQKQVNKAMIFNKHIEQLPYVQEKQEFYSTRFQFYITKILKVMLISRNGRCQGHGGCSRHTLGGISDSIYHKPYIYITLSFNQKIIREECREFILYGYNTI